jgi:hypothetical protein
MVRRMETVATPLQKDQHDTEKTSVPTIYGVPFGQLAFELSSHAEQIQREPVPAEAQSSVMDLLVGKKD